MYKAFKDIPKITKSRSVLFSTVAESMGDYSKVNASLQLFAVTIELSKRTAADRQ